MRSAALACPACGLGLALQAGRRGPRFRPPQQRSGTRWGRRAPPLRASGLLGALAETRAPARTSPAPGPRCHSRATEAAAAAPASGTRATRVGLGGGPAVRVRRSPLGDAQRPAV